MGPFYTKERVENENDGEEQDEDKEEDDDDVPQEAGMNQLTDPGLEYGEKLPAQVIPEIPDFEPPSEISQALAKTNLLNLTVIWIMLHGPQRALVHVATAGKRHSAYWSSQGCFVEVALHDRDPLPKFPLTRDNGRSPISINNPAGTEEAPNKCRPRPDNADEEDTPAFKRQATSRKLRPRGNEAPGRKQARVAPPGKVVAEGKSSNEASWKYHLRWLNQTSKRWCWWSWGRTCGGGTKANGTRLDQLLLRRYKSEKWSECGTTAETAVEQWHEDTELIAGQTELICCAGGSGRLSAAHHAALTI
ncbi:hypothetical protein C8F04DRAFT_1339641 [Mycena alexandri]|uniref:Uncharacterized protein n=1 Tax=Mycena alexandri TaxID=1745969 RepID=A0AAD6X5X0_9AGAR|nr:hypothetical protein C8F04DRAFT_1339641 [Mycena alexandri]